MSSLQCKHHENYVDFNLLIRRSPCQCISESRARSSCNCSSVAMRSVACCACLWSRSCRFFTSSFCTDKHISQCYLLMGKVKHWNSGKWYVRHTLRPWHMILQYFANSVRPMDWSIHLDIVIHIQKSYDAALV